MGSSDLPPHSSSSPPVALRIVRPYRDEDELIEAEAGAFSRTGVVLVGAPSRPNGVVLRFEIALREGQAVMRGEGRVVGYRAPSPTEEGALTLRFTRLDVRSKALLDRAVTLREARRSSLSAEHEALLLATRSSAPPPPPSASGASPIADTLLATPLRPPPSSSSSAPSTGPSTRMRGTPPRGSLPGPPPLPRSTPAGPGSRPGPAPSPAVATTPQTRSSLPSLVSSGSAGPHPSLNEGLASIFDEDDEETGAPLPSPGSGHVVPIATGYATTPSHALNPPVRSQPEATPSVALGPRPTPEAHAEDDDDAEDVDDAELAFADGDQTIPAPGVAYAEERTTGRFPLPAPSGDDGPSGSGRRRQGWPLDHQTVPSAPGAPELGIWALDASAPALVPDEDETLTPPPVDAPIVSGVASPIGDDIVEIGAYAAIVPARGPTRGTGDSERPTVGVPGMAQGPAPLPRFPSAPAPAFDLDVPLPRFPSAPPEVGSPGSESGDDEEGSVAAAGPHTGRGPERLPQPTAPGPARSPSPAPSPPTSSPPHESPDRAPGPKVSPEHAPEPNIAPDRGRGPRGSPGGPRPRRFDVSIDPASRELALVRLRDRAKRLTGLQSFLPVGERSSAQSPDASPPHDAVRSIVTPLPAPQASFIENREPHDDGSR